MKICLAVITCHIAVALGLTTHKAPALTPAKSNLVAVETVQLRPVVSPKRQAASLPAPRPQLEQVSEPVGHASTYHSELAGAIVSFLTLPDYGEVSIQLTLKRSGEVVGLVVEKGGSKTNREYVLKTLPHLTFPPFGQEFPGQADHTFHIALQGA